MNQPHAVLPLEEYDRLKKIEQDFANVIQSQRSTEAFSTQMEIVILKMMHGNDFMRHPEIILRDAGLQIENVDGVKRVTRL